MTIAVVCPDGLSILLFCKGIIRALQSIKGSRVIAVSDDGTYKPQIEALGVTSVSVPIHRFVGPRHDLRYLGSLYRVFRRERCDAVLNFSTKPNVYGPVAARLAGVRTVVSHVVGLGSSFLPTSSLRGRLVQQIVLRLYRLGCQWSDKVWFTNKNDLAFFVARRLVCPARAVLTRNYLDTDFYAPWMVTREELRDVREELGLVAGQKVVVMVARMIWPKGIREFAEAAELLQGRHPDARFLLVAPLENGCSDTVPESYVRAKERGGNFKWLGFRHDVRRLYAVADLAVLPSYYKEGGYPRALLEPMAMGKPIITTTSEDCRATVEEGRNGYLVPARDSRALADAIHRLLADPATRDAFGRYSRAKAVREFDEKQIVAHALGELGILGGR